MQAGSPEPLLASAYRATGNDHEAKIPGWNLQRDYDALDFKFRPI